MPKWSCVYYLFHHVRLLPFLAIKKRKGVLSMGKKDAFERIFSFDDEEKSRLEGVSDEVLEFLKEKELTFREALFVINRCEHVIFDTMFDSGE